MHFPKQSIFHQRNTIFYLSSAMLSVTHGGLIADWHLSVLQKENNSNLYPSVPSEPHHTGIHLCSSSWWGIARCKGQPSLLEEAYMKKTAAINVPDSIMLQKDKCGSGADQLELVKGAGEHHYSIAFLTEALPDLGPSLGCITLL